MSRIVAIGATHDLEGFGLAGVKVVPAATDADVAEAWSLLDDEVGLVILSPAAAAALGPEVAVRTDVLTVVTP